MKTAYIGIGSNLGKRHENCLEAVERMDNIPGCSIKEVSDWYLTEPVGVEGQESYVNGVASIRSGITARDLLKELMSIERKMGRVRVEKWGPRVIDLDILLFGGQIIEEENLVVPHPLMHLRRFVLVPMARLAPDVIHPIKGMTMAQLLESLPEEGQAVNLFRG